MSRHTVVGNGNMLVCLDENGEVRDLYYPRAGLENHIVGLKHRLGIAVSDRFYWLKDWHKYNSQSSNTLKSTNIFKHEGEEIELEYENIVYNEQPVFVRKVTLKNKSNESKDIKLFFGQEFKIKENKYRNTGFYYPTDNVVIHYRGRRVFLLNIFSKDGGIDDYTIGLYGFDQKEGSYVTAEEINLPKNAVEHGPVDSVIAKRIRVEARSESELFYVLIAGKTIDGVLKINNLLQKEKSPTHIFKSTTDYWNAWRNKRPFNFHSLSDEAVKLFYRSLFVIRTHLDEKDGGPIASGDSTMFEFGKDAYAYVWPRDGAFIAKSLAKVGHFTLSKKILSFFSETISKEGYILHKFEVDKSLGSSWHSWIEDGKLKLPIQEDETAIIINALWDFFQITKDVEFLESNYHRLIEKPSDFMCNYFNSKLGLPKHSYDLWEEEYRVYTYTVCTVIDALRKASKFSEILGKTDQCNLYRTRAEDITKGLNNFLYDAKRGIYYKSVMIKEDTISYSDETADASTLFGLWYFGVLDPTEDKFKNFENHIVSRLMLNDKTFIRYEGDRYFKRGESYSNPWIITTLWYIQLKVKRAKNFEELKKVSKDIDDMLFLQTESGLLPEQVDNQTRVEVSATPLVWSHAVYVETIAMYLQKLEEFGVCDTCLPK